MTKGTRGSNRNGRKGNPNPDVQPWLGWIAAMLVVVIVVVAVALGMERTNNQRNINAEVRMTPLVGGMQVPVATATGESVAAASEVTPIPASVVNSETVTMVTVITTTDGVTATDDVTATDGLTTTEMGTGIEPVTDTVAANEAVTATDSVSTTGAMTRTEEMAAPLGVTESAEVTGTEEMTEEAAAEGVATTDATSELTDDAAEVEATATNEVTVTPTPHPTATPEPTATSPVEARSFEEGDTVLSTGGRVEFYADAAGDALVLDSVGTGVALEVIVPSGEFGEYPVVVDGQSWVRVRAEDGLVGWVKTDQVDVE